jgi:hypothetical protein
MLKTLETLVYPGEPCRDRTYDQKIKRQAYVFKKPYKINDLGYFIGFQDNEKTLCFYLI